MVRRLCVAFVVLAAAGFVSAGEGDAAGRPRLLHFRLEVGEAPSRVIPGALLLRPGQGAIATLLDLDGNGSLEARFRPGTGGPGVEFAVEGRTWSLELESPGWFGWSVKVGEFYAWFINGQPKLYPTAEDAVRGDPIRLGPPFRFEIGASTRGPDGFLSIGLKDANGCTLRLAAMGGEERKIHARLGSDGPPALESDLTYG